MPSTPLAAELAPAERLDPARRSSAEWLASLERLDELAYGRDGLTMPRWAFYDCAALPGLVCGLSLPAADLPRDIAERIGRGPRVPVSMAMAVPTVAPDHWLMHTLCSAAAAGADGLPWDVRRVTLALGLALTGARRVTATAQWASSELEVYARAAALEVRAAWSPAHSVPATCTFAFELEAGTPAALLARDRAAGGDPWIDEWLDPRDDRRLVELQQEIEQGQRIAVCGPARGSGAASRIPLRRGPP